MSTQQCHLAEVTSLPHFLSWQKAAAERQSCIKTKAQQQVIFILNFLLQSLFSPLAPMFQCTRASMPHSNKAVLVVALSNINFVTLHNILLQNKLKPFASNNLYIDIKRNLEASAGRQTVNQPLISFYDVTHSLVISQNLITGHPERSIKEQAQNLLEPCVRQGKAMTSAALPQNFMN